MTLYQQLHQRWLDQARRTKRCPECDCPARPGSLYCSPICVDFAYRREILGERR